MKVEKDSRKVAVTKIVEETVDTFVIELSHDEACALQAVLGKVGGWTYRKPNLRAVVASQLFNSLQGQGIDYWSPEVQKYEDTITQSLKISDE